MMRFMQNMAPCRRALLDVAVIIVGKWSFSANPEY